MKRGLLPVWQAFHALCGDRQAGLAIGPIPFIAIDRYAARFGIERPDEFERFHALLRAMDATYLQHMAERMREARRE